MESFELWPGGPKLEKSGDAESVCTDSVLLANFPSLSGVTRAADLGCGSGVIGIILAFRSRRIGIDMVELSSRAAALAERNIAANGLSDRLRVMNRDLRGLRQSEVGRYQLVISNPPYYPLGSGTPPAESRAMARQELECSLAELADVSSKLLGDGGRLALVYPAERLAQAFCTLSSAGLEPKRLRLVQARVDKAPSVALMECRRGGRPGLSVEPALIIKDPGGADTDEIRKIYRL